LSCHFSSSYLDFSNIMTGRTGPSQINKHTTLLKTGDASARDRKV
jgi:hypothetical protein